MPLRLRAALRERAEWCEVDASDLLLGRGDQADVALEHTSVAPEQARLLVRRGRVILVALSKNRGNPTWRLTRGVRERVTTPVTIDPGDVFGFGEVELRAELAERPAPVRAGDTFLTARVDRELDAEVAHARRYRVQSGGEWAELLMGSEPTGGEWSLLLERTRAASVNHVLPLVACGWSPAGEYLIEATPAGLRLSTLLARLERRSLSLPPAGALAVLALATEALAAWHRSIGAHGQVDAARCYLDERGEVRWARPAPRSARGPLVEDACLAPEARFGGEPSVAGDAFALGTLGKRILRAAGSASGRLRALCAWLAHVEPRRRPLDLWAIAEEARAAAFASGRDPGAVHVARIARVAGAHHRPPLVHARPGVRR